MTRWAQVSDAELDERLAAELRVAAGNGDADQWTREELLPTIRARMSAARERRSPRLSLAQFAGLGAALGLSAVLALVVLTRLPGSWPGGPHGEAHAGDFVLTIMADEPFYTPGQPIGVQAGFLYQGPDQRVVVSTSHPITMFHVRQLDGPLEMTGDAPAICMRYELERHEQLTRQFTKTGGWSRSDPNADFYETWWSAPDLWLPAGRWQISAYSDFNLGADCAGERLTMEAAIEVLVRERSEPSPSASPPVADASVVPLATHEPDGLFDPRACPASLAYGELVAHADWGIALEVGTIKRIQRVLWPHGFVGRWLDGRLALTDGSGNVVAHVGDIVELGGGFVSDDTWLACGELEVLPPPSPSPATPSALPSLSPEPTAERQAVGNIRTIAPGPLGRRAAHSAVWTGSDMIVWGGTPGNDNVPAADGAAFDPATNTWRTIAAAPMEPRAGHSAIWTGSEMILWGGSAGPDGPSNGAQAHGAAYDPATDSWRPIAEAPAGRLSHSVVWTGSEMIVWGGRTPGHAPSADGFAYAPLSDSWRELPPLPVEARASHSAVWTGSEMIIWGGSGSGPANGSADGATYDPTDDSGRAL